MEGVIAGQHPSRRELIQALALAGAASACPGFVRWSYALKEGPPQDDSLVQPAYQLQYFTTPQYRAVEVLADLILPSMTGPDGQPQPGAKEAGVAEFIDFMVFSDPTLQPQFRDGLAWLDRAAVPSASFAKLSAPEQNALLERLAYKAKHRAGEEAGQTFFLLMRKYTVMGFYTSRIGLESLDFPGLKFYVSSPGCTHPGNPEHVGL